MENVGAYCSWGPGSLNTSHQSQWLQTTLSDLDNKMKAMKTLLEEDGNLSINRADIYHERKPEMKQMLEEFDRSYRSLAEKYDKLRSQSEHMLQSGSSSSSSMCKKVRDASKKMKRVAGSSDNPKLEAFYSHSESAIEDPDVECDSADHGFEYMNKLADELTWTEAFKINFKPKLEIKETQVDEEITNFSDNEEMTMNGFQFGHATAGDFTMDIYEWDDTGSELKFQVTKLMEENLRQQAELLRRNKEKREAIKELRLQLEHSKAENRTLQSFHRCKTVEVKRKQIQISRLRGLFLKPLFRGGCS